MNRKHLLPIVVAVLILAVAGAAGWRWAARGHEHRLVEAQTPDGETWWTCSMHPEVRQDRPGNCPICGMRLIERRTQAQPGRSDTGDTDARKILYWYDPMKPEVRFDAPGRSPFMDMDLVPRYADGAAGGAIGISAQIVQNLGIRTRPVERGTFWQRVDTVGTLAVDPHRIRVIESRAPGWVETQRVHTAGERVRAGETLATVYAPELHAAQEELLLAARGGDPGVLTAARQRLRALGATPAQIDAVLAAGRAQRQWPLVAPIDGFVLEIDVHEGQQVGAGMPLMRVADLSTVWLQAEVPESRAGWVAGHRPAEARFAALPGRVFEGRIDYVYPVLDPVTRTLRVRVAFDNTDGALRPGMYAGVTLFGGPRHDVLTIPSEALIRTGTRSVVIVAEPGHSFRPVTVAAGDERAGRTVILSGLTEGEQVVVSGQFLIDSEASLRGAFNRLAPAQPEHTP